MPINYLRSTKATHYSTTFQYNHKFMYTEFSTMALGKRNTPIKSTRLPCTTTVCNYRTTTRATDVRGRVVARVALVRA